MGYSYKDYWAQLHQREDLSSVGQSTLPGGLNKWIYRSIRLNMRRFVKRHGLTSTGGRMLEVGVGTGYWLDFWEQHGWQVDGCDLVPLAVERLRAARPSSHFWVADVGSEDGVLAGAPDAPVGGYDLVTVTSVLLHVTDDEAFARALRNVAAAVRPGGHLLLVEPILTHTKKAAPYSPKNASRARVRRASCAPCASRACAWSRSRRPPCSPRTRSRPPARGGWRPTTAGGAW